MTASHKRTQRIGLIGLGLVGTAIAEILLDRSFELVGHDIDPARCDLLSRRGAAIADSPLHVASRADRLLLALPDSTVVADVLNGKEGVLKAKTLPQYCIDTTTADPDNTVRLARQCDQHGVAFLDATISGSSRQIAQRQGVFMVGGLRDAFDACRPLLNVLSDKVFYLGPSGSGARAKLASNLILGLNRAALAEGLVFAEKLGLDTRAFLDLLKHTPAYSAAMDSKGERMIRGDFAPESRIRQHKKDVSLILRHAEKAGQQLPLSRVHLDILEHAIAAGEGDLDNAAVILELRRRVADSPTR